MNKTFIIAKKELFRFFSDRRLLISTILLPGLMVYVMYTLMGSAFSNMFGQGENAPRVLALNAPASINEIAAEPNYELDLLSVNSEEDGKNQVSNKNADVLMVFPDDFDEAVAAYDNTSAQPAPNVAVYYDSSDTISSAVYSAVVGMLDEYEGRIANKFDVNRDNSASDLATGGGGIGDQLMSTLLPFLIMIFLFTACLAIVPDSFAGEKERGTIATLLITPVKRSGLVMGKIIALGVIALCGGISSFLGTFLSLPNLMGGAGGETAVGLDAYGIEDYIFLLLIIMSTLLMMVSLLSIVSAYAKTVKEATTLATPIMILVMVVGIMSMFGSGAQTDFWYYLIPAYNTVQCLIGVFGGDFIMTNIIIGICSNIVYAGLFVFIITKMYNNEKIIFAR